MKKKPISERTKKKQIGQLSVFEKRGHTQQQRQLAGASVKHSIASKGRSVRTLSYATILSRVAIKTAPVPPSSPASLCMSASHSVHPALASTRRASASRGSLGEIDRLGYQTGKDNNAGVCLNFLKILAIMRYTIYIHKHFIARRKVYARLIGLSEAIIRKR